MGIQVVMQGSQAKTDGKTIYLPALPEGDDFLWILARGYIDHEAGHVRHTDFSVMEGTPIHRTLTNILEDIRIEQEMGRTYPGCAVNLRNLATHLAREGAFTPDANRPEQLLLGWILTECRSRVLRQEALAPIARKAHKDLADLLGPSLVGKIEKILANVDSLQSTRQAADLAERIIRLLEQEQKAAGQQQQEQQKDRQQGQENQPGGPGHEQVSSSSTSNEDGKKGRKKDGKRDNPASKSDGTGSKPDQNSNQNILAAGGSGTDPDQLRKALERILAEKPGGFGDIGAECAEKLNATSQNSNERDRTGIYPGEASAQDLPLGIPPGLHQVRAETVGLRSRLTRLIQASKLKRTSAGRMGRLVDHRVLHRLPIGDSRVFRRKDEKTAVNTAVLVLLDRSGSMDCGTGRIGLAKKTVMALADALGTVPGVSVAAAAFPGPRSQVVPLTRFGQSVAKSKVNYGIGASGGTPLDRALGWVRAQMAVRQEPRKIVLVATDGEPGNPSAAKTMIRKLESEGVELMGLGILDQGTTGYYFRKHRTITSLQELPEAVFGMLQDALTEK
jgi:Mg-chelatase subunit ChlD